MLFSYIFDVKNYQNWSVIGPRGYTLEQQCPLPIGETVILFYVLLVICYGKECCL